MRPRKDTLNIYIRDKWQQYWQLTDAQGARFSTGENGFKEASWTLPRPFSFSYEDLPLDGQVFFFSSRGDTVWHGRLDSIQARKSGGRSFLDCTATGYWSTLYDSFITGTLATSATPEAMLSTLLSGGSAPHLSSDTTGLTVTGLSGLAYQTPNGGTDHVPVGDVVLEICKKGTSTTGERVVPLVLTGRKLITRVLAATPSAAYAASATNLESIALKRDLNSVYNQVLVRYKSSTDNTLQIVTLNDTTGQSLLGMDYGSGVVSLVRSTIRDITGLAATTSAAATTLGNAVLTNTKRVLNEPQQITILRDNVVLDTTLGAEIPNWKVQAGYWCSVSDLFPRRSDPADVAVGQTPNDEATRTMFYISETSYDVETGQLTLRPGAGSNQNEVPN